jgi:hypothetical protein
MTHNEVDLAEALACAFGLAPRAMDTTLGDARWYETRQGRRSSLIVRAGTLSLRHGDGWTLVVSTDAGDQSSRAEITGQYLSPSAIDQLRDADQRVHGQLWEAIERGRHRQTRYAARLLQSVSVVA